MTRVLLLLALCAPLSAQDAEPIRVYLLAGQSNMVGYTSAKWVETNAPEMARARDDAWCLWNGDCKRLAPGAGHEVGPELAMGHVLGKKSKAPLLFCKYAVGGTTITKHWRSPSIVARAGGELGHLYKNMIKKFYRVLADPAGACPGAKGRPYELAGFVWFQGENDCFDGMEKKYEANLRDLVKDVRAAVGTPALPVIVVQINDSDVWDKAGGGGPAVREAQRKVAAEDEHAALVTTLDLGEGYHYSDGDHVTIGRRVGEALLPFLDRTAATNPATIAAARKELDALFYPGRGPRPPRPHVHLSDVAWVSGAAGWGGEPRKDRSIEGRPLAIDGTRYAKGIGTHAESTLVYELKSEWRRFVAVAGIDDEMGNRDVCSVVFRVSFDGKKAAQSVLMKSQEAWHFDVAIPKGAKRIRLDVLEGDSGINSDHADWADAGFRTDTR